MRRIVGTMIALVVAAAVVPGVVAAGTAQASQPATTATTAPALGNGLARTPPMGWNDWNSFGCNVNAALVEQTAQYLVSSGMQAAGYHFVNIDDCWMAGNRDANGNLVPDPAKFTNGITAVADYVHSLGLGLGIYESAGTATCQGYPGSLNHERQDANSFASWGIDYLKYDNCNNQGDPDQQRYTAMRDALAATGRPIVYSLCNWGNASVWTWGSQVGNLWRTTGDISANFGSMLSNLFGQSNPQQQAGLLNTLISSVGPGVLASALSKSGVGGGLTDLIRQGGQVTPEQASQVSPDAVHQAAAEAEKKDPSVVDRVSEFYAEHPTLVQALGAGALAVAMGKMGNRL